jgi:hypothetical protein
LAGVMDRLEEAQATDILATALINSRASV